MSSSTLLRNIVILSLALFTLVGYHYIQATGTWTNAPTNPPSNNTEAPINVGTSTASAQLGNGNLGFDQVTAFTKMNSDQYCDSLGLNCFFGRTLVQLLSTSTPVYKESPLYVWQCPVAGDRCIGQAVIQDKTHTPQCTVSSDCRDVCNHGSCDTICSTYTILDCINLGALVTSGGAEIQQASTTLNSSQILAMLADKAPGVSPTPTSVNYNNGGGEQVCKLALPGSVPLLKSTKNFGNFITYQLSGSGVSDGNGGYWTAWQHSCSGSGCSFSSSADVILSITCIKITGH